jgi:hypothetical protein
VYVLVTLLEGPKFGEVEFDHEPFVDSLVAKHLVLLVGDLVGSGQGVRAAYVLRCDDLATAEAIVATDPLVTSDPNATSTRVHASKRTRPSTTSAAPIPRESHTRNDAACSVSQDWPRPRITAARCPAMITMPTGTQTGTVATAM